MATLFYLIIWVVHVNLCDSIWTRFDFVRKRYGSWGSPDNTSFIKIERNDLLGLTLSNSSAFGHSLANIGDLDGDGMEELVVGAPGESSYLNYSNIFQPMNATNGQTQLQAGAVYVLYLNPITWELRKAVRISGNVGGGPPLFELDNFGWSVANAGDVNGDGVVDIIVGAPGYVLSSAYILYMDKNGTAKDWTLIRGYYYHASGRAFNASIITPKVELSINATLFERKYVQNGPPIHFESRFGETVAGIGDLDKDGCLDVAVTSMEYISGDSTVYILFLNNQSTVLSYREIGSSLNGGPDLGGVHFTGFGSSITVFPDLDGDGVDELAISANKYDDAMTIHYHSGVVFLCYMFKNGTIKDIVRISELAEQKTTYKNTLPVLMNDECGSSVITTGDINLDNMRQHWPWLPSSDPSRISHVDMIIGCPQSKIPGMPGRLFLLFLDGRGHAQKYTVLPSATDEGEAPDLKPQDRFGKSMAAYSDLDQNGLREFVVGAPGDSSKGFKIGAIYVCFIRRRRFHPPVVCHLCYYLSFGIPLACLFCACFWGSVYFCWYFRRKPDDLEQIVLKSGVEITAKRERKRRGSRVYAEENYDL